MKIVCLGDSFTKGFGVGEGESWFDLLGVSSPHEFINKGMNGDTSGGMLARFHQDVILEKPNYVFISGGVNDFICDAQLSAVQANIMALVHQAYENNIVPVILTEPPCEPALIRRDWVSFSDFNTVAFKLKSLQQWMLHFSSTFQINCIDLHNALSQQIKFDSKEDYYIDGLHLTVKGHRMIADIINESLVL
ncbi:GDSL-type esterase/lipase family protein [Clostridium aminobutyricum]|uniref:Arylesterase n=1 Tax=Clostridium aminobutyricum TaxID=33953 RepID=A0A939IGD3_CLOAM|nr:GDSL-type esterase/lipase family protein [Clostridium aminobutyricum]MBN7773125.1 arylesterase [Clostridium aminobutyricum]